VSKDLCPKTTTRASRPFLHSKFGGRAPVQGPSVCTHHTFHGQMRPKKEDWLKKKERNRRRPGCRRRRPHREGELLPWALLFPPGEPPPLSRNLSNPSPDHSQQSPTSLVREWTASTVPLDSPGMKAATTLCLQGGFPPGAPVSTQSKQLSYKHFSFKITFH